MHLSTILGGLSAARSARLQGSTSLSTARGAADMPKIPRRKSAARAVLADPHAAGAAHAARAASPARRVAVVVAVLAAMAVLAFGGAVAYASNQPTCGLEEHEHSSACYESVLSCGYDEGEELEDGSVHEHSEECYTQELSCGLAEHAHDESCYPEQADVLEALVATVTGADEDAGESGSVAASDEDADEDEEPDAYISSVSCDAILDGVVAFDDVEYDDDGNVTDDEPGNDSSASNGSVRTFDDIVYSLSATVRTTGDSLQMDEVTLVTTARMDKDLYEAKFDIDDMSWALVDESEWQINYYDADGELVLYQTASGLRNASNAKTTSFNAHVGESADSSASDVSLESTYGSEIASQELVVKTRKSVESGSATLEIHNLDVYVYVMASECGDTFTPEFSFCLEDNEENVDGEGSAAAASVTCDGSCDDGDAAYAVEVTSALRLNALIRSTSVKAGYFDVDEGTLSSADDEDAVYGRLLNYGVALELYNETNSSDSSVLTEKGLAGVVLPLGTITLELTLDTTVPSAATSAGYDEDDFKTFMWDYFNNGGFSKGSTGGWGRTVSFSSSYGNNGSIPFTGSGSKSTHAFYCYDGGTWTVTGIDYDGDGTIDSTEKSDLSLSTSATTYTLELSGYDFDFDTWHFATRANSGSYHYAYSYIGVFSTQCVEVLQTWPSELASADVTALTVTNTATLELCSTGQGSCEDVKSSDNTASYAASTFVKPSLVQTSYFSGASDGSPSYTTNTTSNWAVLGAQGMAANARLSYAENGSGYYMSDCDELVLFDSEALDIEEDSEPYGTGHDLSSSDDEDVGDTTYFYAADPLYQDGYDSTESAVLTRMNSVTQEDLIYFESLEECEQAGYTCVGVLFETRGCSIDTGYIWYYVPLSLRVYTRSSERAATGSDGTVDESALELVEIGEGVVMISSSRCWSATKLLNGTSLDEDVTWANAAITADNVDESLDEDGIENYIADDDGAEVDFTSMAYYMYYRNTGKSSNNSGTGYGKLTSRRRLVNGTWSGSVSVNWGNCLVPIGFAATPDIKVAYADGSGYTDDTAGYNVSESQTTAHCTLDVDAEVATAGGIGGMPVDLDVTVELDDGLTFEASSFTCDDVALSVSRSEQDAVAAVVSVVYDDVAYDVSVTAIVDSGLTTVTLSISGLPAGAQLSFDYDTVLTGVVESNVTYYENVTTSAELDPRPNTETNGNIDDVGIVVTSFEPIGIQEYACDDLVEYGDDVVFELVTKSISYSATSNVMLLDILPYDGDASASTVASGAYTVSSITVDFSEAELAYADAKEGASSLYVTAEDVSGYAYGSSAEDDDDAAVSQVPSVLAGGMEYDEDEGAYLDSEGTAWYALECSSDDDALTMTYEGSVSATALFVAIDTFYALESVTMTVVLSPVERSEAEQGSACELAGDVFANTFYKGTLGSSLYLQSNIVSTTVVERDVSGMAWEDADQDGLYDEGEALLSGIDVGLYRTNASACAEDGTQAALTLADGTALYAAYDAYGEELAAVATDDDGAYAFEDLEAGTYYAVVAADEYSDTYELTATDAGSDDELDSDFAATTATDASGSAVDVAYVALGAFATAAELSTAGASSYIAVTDVDLGLVADAVLAFSKVAMGDTSTTLAGAVFALYEWTGDDDADASALVTYDASSGYTSTSVGWTLVKTATSDDAGTVSFGSLSLGVLYRLVEVVAPGGYVCPTGQWDVTPTAATAQLTTLQIEAVYESSQPPAFGVYSDDDGEESGYYLPNKASTVLPSSGGTWPWLVGLALLALAAAFALAGKKMRAAPRPARPHPRTRTAGRAS